MKVTFRIRICFSIICYVGADVCTLQERAAKALRALKRFKDEVANEQQHNFSPYSVKGKRPRFGGAPVKRKPSTVSWTHQFVCLADRFKAKPPMASWERQALLEARLGERKISFRNIDCNSEEFRDRLLREFPKLKEGGGFEFMRCAGNSRTLEPISSTALQSPRVTQERVGRSKVYIRPIQADLDMTPTKSDIMEPETVGFILNEL